MKPVYDLSGVAYILNNELSERLEEFAAAFLKRTDIDPRECIMVQRPYFDDGGIGTEYFYVRKPLGDPVSADLQRILKLRGLTYNDWIAEKIAEDEDLIGKVEHKIRYV